MLAYYWVLATPAVGFLFGCYLYIAVNWFHVHYDEAFSALRIPNFKGFSRLHINKDGDLEVYGLAMDKVSPPAHHSTATPTRDTPTRCIFCLVCVGVYAYICPESVGLAYVLQVGAPAARNQGSLSHCISTCAA